MSDQDTVWVVLRRRLSGCTTIERIFAFRADADAFAGHSGDFSLLHVEEWPLHQAHEVE